MWYSVKIAQQSFNVIASQKFLFEICAVTPIHYLNRCGINCGIHIFQRSVQATFLQNVPRGQPQVRLWNIWANSLFLGLQVKHSFATSVNLISLWQITNANMDRTGVTGIKVSQHIEAETKWTPTHFMNENVRISTNISLKFVPRGLINNIPALVQIMVWRRPGAKPLSETMMVSVPTHICVIRARSKWVKDLTNTAELNRIWTH